MAHQSGCNGQECGGLCQAECDRVRRAFSKFTLFAKEQNNWVEEAQYSPSLPYGGNCAADVCKTSFEPGTVLAVCVNVSRPIAAQEYRAVFLQAVGPQEEYSGPQVLQLDGYAQANCTN